MDTKTRVGIVIMTLVTALAACLPEEGIDPAPDPAQPEPGKPDPTGRDPTAPEPAGRDPAVPEPAEPDPAAPEPPGPGPVPTAPPDRSCTDSDGGRDYGMRGSIAGTTISWGDDDRRAFDDCCVDFGIGEFGQVVDQCQGARCAIDEWFCRDGVIMYEYVPCEFGCRDGACLPAPTCTDSDGGRDYGVHGSIAGTTISWSDDDRRAFDDCCVDFGIGEFGQVVDQCQGARCAIDEWFCRDGVIMYEYVPCPAGCRNGVCSAPPVPAP